MSDFMRLHTTENDAGRFTRLGRLLLVEDDPKLCGTLQRLFRFAGYEVIAVTRSLEALPLLGTRKPRVILLDLNLPVMDGLMLLEVIRADREFDDVPVLIHTADFSESNEALARRLGAQDYIVKGTLPADALLQRVHDVILGLPSEPRRDRAPSRGRTFSGSNRTPERPASHEVRR